MAHVHVGYCRDHGFRLKTRLEWLTSGEASDPLDMKCSKVQIERSGEASGFQDM